MNIDLRLIVEIVGGVALVVTFWWKLTDRSKEAEKIDTAQNLRLQGVEDKQKALHDKVKEIENQVKENKSELQGYFKEELTKIENKLESINLSIINLIEKMK